MPTFSKQPPDLTRIALALERIATVLEMTHSLGVVTDEYPDDSGEGEDALLATTDEVARLWELYDKTGTVEGEGSRVARLLRARGRGA